MYTDGKIWLGQSADKNIYLLPQMANRHGLISGATGTGKTITMKVLAESFSAMGVPVFFSDVKGDLSGMCRPGGGQRQHAPRASPPSVLITSPIRPIRPASGISLASKDIPCALRYPAWARRCWRGC